MVSRVPAAATLARTEADEDDFADAPGDFAGGDGDFAAFDPTSEGTLARTAAPMPSGRTPTPAATPRSAGSAALAPASRPIVSRVAQPEQARPHLQLVRTEPTPTVTAAPQPMISRAAERLAGATGGAIEQGEGGLSTVHFPAPEISTTHQPYTISRELADPAPAQQPQIGGHRNAAQPQAQAPAEQSGGEKQMDPEELYEYFLDRFKRDLIVEREQLGHLIIDNP